MTRLRPAATRPAAPLAPAAPVSLTPNPAQLTSDAVDSFTPAPPAPLPSLLSLPIRPVPQIEVPGVGVLTKEQGEKVLAASRAAVNQVTAYARFHHASLPPETLSASSDAGALKALRELGYPQPKDLGVINAQVGALLDWARSPFVWPTAPATSAKVA